MDKKERNIKFFDEWAASYDRFIFSFWLKMMHKKVLKFISRKQGLKILDVSCGTGELLLLLSNKLEKAELYGVDISRNMIRLAEKKIGEKARINCSDVESLQFKDAMFDYVITTESFHHYVNQEKALQEMKRVLKKNGKLIVADVNFYLFFVNRLFEMLEPGCVKINSKKGFYEMFKRNDFKEIKQARSIFAIITSGVK